MSEVEQKDELSRLKLPIEWHVPDTIHSQYVNNVVVQPGMHEITLFFFETQIPPYVGTPEENREHLIKKGFVQLECVSKMIVAPQLVPELIKALQIGLENYNAIKAFEESEKENE